MLCEHQTLIHPTRQLTRLRVAGTICRVGSDDQFAGTCIRNTGFEEETRAFLQLRLLLAILCAVFAA